MVNLLRHKKARDKRDSQWLDVVNFGIGSKCVKDERIGYVNGGNRFFNGMLLHFLIKGVEVVLQHVNFGVSSAKVATTLRAHCTLLKMHVTLQQCLVDQQRLELRCVVRKKCHYVFTNMFCGRPSVNILFVNWLKSAIKLRFWGT